VPRIEEFKDCYDLVSLSKTMVQLERHIVFPLVYRIIELALLLPVATTTVERAFSAMKIIKTKLRNKMTDGWLNDLIVCYIEREIYKGLDLQQIIKAFQIRKIVKCNCLGLLDLDVTTGIFLFHLLNTV
jgi:hypothetical protein